MTAQTVDEFQQPGVVGARFGLGQRAQEVEFIEAEKWFVSYRNQITARQAQGQ
ncbi:MAG: hypothetical protein R2873_09930 [Caldilineaceae bacterium]